MYFSERERLVGWMELGWRRGWVGAGWEAVDRGWLDVGEADVPLVDYVDRYDGVE